MYFVCKRVEYLGYQHIFLFPQVFQKFGFSVCPCIKNTSSCQRAGRGIKSHLETALAFRGMPAEYIIFWNTIHTTQKKFCITYVLLLGRPERLLSLTDCVALKHCNSLDIVLRATPNTAATCLEDCPALSIPRAWLLSLLLGEGLLPIFNSIAHACTVGAIKWLLRYMYMPWVFGKACMKENSVYKFGQKISYLLKKIPKICFFLYILPIF